jgi:hypothetical protein
MWSWLLIVPLASSVIWDMESRFCTKWDSCPVGRFQLLAGRHVFLMLKMRVCVCRCVSKMLGIRRDERSPGTSWTPPLPRKSD